MKLHVETEVEQDFRTVFAQFDRTLFAALNPPFPRLRVLRFDGCAVGDVYDLELDFIVTRQRWRGRVTDAGADARSCWFVDEGEQLPFFLSRWRHRHVVRAAGSGAVIVDEIVYEAPSAVIGWLMAPALWLQFLYRKPIYRRRFADET